MAEDSGSRGNAWRRPLAAIVAGAAGIVLFAAGLTLGRRFPPARSQGSARFVLLLYGDPAVTEKDRAARETQDRRWESGLPAGRLVAGEKLGLGGRWLGAPRGAVSAEGAQLRGWVVIEAPDLAHAADLARTCPHLRRGGRVLVRPIDPS
jgi:hypothetical protein